MNFSDNGRNSSDHSRAETIVIINSVLNAPLILISILGNALVLLAIFRTPSIHSTLMIMLASLAFSDLLVGLLAQPLFIADEITSLTTQNPILYRLSAMIGFFVAGVSLGTITTISVDRVLALHYHMRYAIIVTNTRVKYTVGTIWLVMFLSLGFYLWDKYVFHLMAGVFSAVCIIICTASYAKIYRIARVHQQQINIQHNAVENGNDGNKMQLSRVKKSAMSTFIFYICMLFCYFPAFVLLTLFGTLQVPWKREWTFSSTLTFMNSAFNPFLYCWRLRELREAIVKTTKQLFHPLNEN
ncbi:melanocyte-stimulating hormone receptor-like [Porites lutea]|uniref:melanocyte-stimulating hormone receptor-like n=1 Tax=Porites lutea TaxID=51062 RepID=UPI003CC5AE02